MLVWLLLLVLLLVVLLLLLLSFPLMLLFTWFSVDGSYWLYWHCKAPTVLELMRWDNFITSLPMYGICGGIWLYQGSFSEFMAEIKALRTYSRSD